MAFRLIVTRPDSSLFQSSTDPLPTREAVGMSALKVLAEQGIAFGRDGLTFGRKLRDTAIGETIEHEPTGYRFRTEEF